MNQLVDADPSSASAAVDTDTNATTRKALARISVAAPYFAFTDIELLGERAVATVPPCWPAGTEVGAMEAAQIARHLAILGSCAAALARDDDKRHHYLATKATYRRVPGTTTQPNDGGLTATASSKWVDKRSVVATTALLHDGVVLNELDVEYAVLAPRMFARFNPPLAEDARTPPGRDQLDVIRAGEVIRDCGGVDEAMCAGHFPEHPAAPVALLMGRLVGTAGDAMSSALGRDVGYIVESGTVEATGLAQAGQHLVLQARHMGVVDDLHELTGEATADGEVVGRVVVRLRPVERR